MKSMITLIALALLFTVHAHAQVGSMPSMASTTGTTSTTSTGPTTGTPATGPETIFGPKNLLAQRYRSHFPPIIHVVQSDGDGQWTAYTESNQIRMIAGLVGTPLVTYKPSKEEIEKAAQLGASLTIDNKIELAKLFISIAEKTIGELPPMQWLPQPRLTPIEKRLLDLSGLVKKVRGLFHKVEISHTQAEKVFWGLQIRVLTLYIDNFTGRLMHDIWEEIDGDLDRGQVAILPGHKLDLLANVILVHAMYRDEDTAAFGRLVENIKKRLLGEQSSLGDYPPGQQLLRKPAIERRLQVIEGLVEVLQNG